MKPITTVLAAAGAIAVSVFAIVAFANDSASSETSAKSTNSTLVERGRYLVHRVGIPRHRGQTGIASDSTSISTRARFAAWWTELRRDVSDSRFLGLALWFTAHAAAFSGLVFQLVPILQSERVPTATMLQAIALIGPMQVLGRLALATWGEHFATLRVGSWAMLVLRSSLALMLFLRPTLASLSFFAILYGGSNGVMTILRGTAIAELFGRERYAELNGALSLPAVLAKAASPFALAARGRRPVAMSQTSRRAWHLSSLGRRDCMLRSALNPAAKFKLSRFLRPPPAKSRTEKLSACVKEIARG